LSVPSSSLSVQVAVVVAAVAVAAAAAAVVAVVAGGGTLLRTRMGRGHLDSGRLTVADEVVPSIRQRHAPQCHCD